VLAKYWPWWPTEVVNWTLRAVRRLTSPAVIDPELMRTLGQMIKGVQVVAIGRKGIVRAQVSH